MQTIQLLNSNYNRVVKENLGTLLKKGDRFTLENGYYVNEDETIIFKSTDKTGKLFTKEDGNKEAKVQQ